MVGPEAPPVTPGLGTIAGVDLFDLLGRFGWELVSEPDRTIETTTVVITDTTTTTDLDPDGEQLALELTPESRVTEIVDPGRSQEAEPQP